MSTEKQLVERYARAGTFFFWSTAIPWCVWLLAGWLSHRSEDQTSIGIITALGLVGLVAPMLVALRLAWGDSVIFRDIRRRLFRFDWRSPYSIAALVILPASLLLAQAISLLFGHSATQFQLRGGFSFSSGLLPVWFLLIIAPIFEELGWHTYGTDALRARWTLFKTCVVFALLWGVWHIPLGTIKGYYQAEVVETGWIYGVNFLVSLFPFVFLMNWLYYRTGRSVLVATLFHIEAGFFNEIFLTHPDSKVIQTALLLVLSVIVIWWERPLFFDRKIPKDFDGIPADETGTLPTRA